MSNFPEYRREEFEFGIVGRVMYDEFPSPFDGDALGKIAYCSSSETLGTENVNRERMDEIRDGIKDGSLVGLPVYAYVHGGATIRCTPFSDPWDSGQSGFSYCTRERAFAECASIEAALKCLEAEVKLHDDYLTGKVFGYVVKDAEDNLLDSCWGYYGIEDADGYCLECMRDAAAYAVEKARGLQAEFEFGETHDDVVDETLAA